MRRLLALLLCFVCAATAQAKYRGVDTEDVPISRLIANATKKLAADPKDQATRATLARLHAMAYATKADVAHVRKGTNEVFEGHDPPGIPWTVAEAKDDATKKAAREHL